MNATTPLQHPHRGWPALYAIFIIWASLYSEHGWHAFPVDLFAYLFEPLPQWITRTDLATNLIVYLPLGYLLRRQLGTWPHPWLAVFAAALLSATLSLSLETLQQALLARNASTLDIAVNALGALSGAIISLHHQRWRRTLYILHTWRDRSFHAGAATDLGLSLLGLWLLAQFSLRPLPGIGWLTLHLRPIDTQPGSLNDLNLSWFFSQSLEMICLGAFLATLLRPGRYVGALTLCFMIAFLTKLITATILLKWAAVGGLLSLETLAAFFCAFWFLLLPWVSRHRRHIAIAALITIVTWRLWEGGPLLWPKHSLLNLVGLAATLAAWWPLLGLITLGIQGHKTHATETRRTDH
ncbi:MAG: hypothetical protein D4R70_06930 [Betaproteobacteria bacterium]|nr:MAG: hypothetical protein D4R70_06930 [Betaproteobacteria bacterium]